jgi:hypothetical protein
VEAFLPMLRRRRNQKKLLRVARMLAALANG